MANLTASPTPKNLVADRDQDLTHEITLPAGSYLSGGASGWALQYQVTHPTTGTPVFTKTTGGSGIVVTTGGSTTVDAVFTVTIPDTDILAAAVSLGVKYNWIFKRTDAGSEVNLDAGTLTFRR